MITQPRRPSIKPGQKTKQSTDFFFFQLSLTWEGPVSPTQRNIISGLSSWPGLVALHRCTGRTWRGWQRAGGFVLPAACSSEVAHYRMRRWCYITQIWSDSTRVYRRTKYLNVFNTQHTERQQIGPFRPRQMGNALKS